VAGFGALGVFSVHLDAVVLSWPPGVELLLVAVSLLAGMLKFYPIVLLVLAFAVLYLAERVGVFLHGKRGDLASGERDDYSLIVASSLTLLALIIGFTFSMSIGRYDQRKNYEEAEANAIGTEYLRSDFFPAPDAARLAWLHQRSAIYDLRRGAQIIHGFRILTRRDQLLRGRPQADKGIARSVDIAAPGDYLRTSCLLP